MTGTRKIKKSPRMGSTFDHLLRQQTIYEAVQTTAIRRVLAIRLAEAMKERNLTTAKMARSMRTSRVQLERLLDPDDDNVTLSALCHGAAAVGRELRFGLV